MSESTRTSASFGAGVVTPSNTADIPKVNGTFPRALQVNGAGDVHLMAPDGTEAVWTCGGPLVIPAQVSRVFVTGTTVTASIIPLY